MTDLELLTRAYIEAIYFTETGDNDQPESNADLDALSKATTYNDCRSLYTSILELPEHLRPADLHQLWVQIGHDFWLTRNCHGVGFWDRPEIYGQDPARVLTAMATTAGGHDVGFEGHPTP